MVPGIQDIDQRGFSTDADGTPRLSPGGDRLERLPSIFV